MAFDFTCYRQMAQRYRWECEERGEVICCQLCWWPRRRWCACVYCVARDCLHCKLECTQVEFGNLFPQTFTFNDVLSWCALYCVSVGERNKMWYLVLWCPVLIRGVIGPFWKVYLTHWPVILCSRRSNWYMAQVIWWLHFAVVFSKVDFCHL
jgi:hypothetical protein